jgi:hypothetical protein
VKFPAMEKYESSEDIYLDMIENIVHLMVNLINKNLQKTRTSVKSEQRFQYKDINFKDFIFW